MNKLRKLIELLCLGISWGSGFMLIKISLDSFSPILLTTFRCFLSGSICLALSGIKIKKTTWNMPMTPQLILVAVCTNAIPFTLCTYGEVYAHSATAGITEGLIPLFTTLLSVLMIKKFKLDKTHFIGVLLGLIGLLIMFISSFTDNINNNEIGRFLLIGMAFFFSLGFILGEKFLKNLDPIQLCSSQHLIAGFTLLPLALYFEDPSQIISAPIEGYQAMLCLCILNSLGWSIYYHLIQNTSAAFVSISTYIVPVTAVFMGQFFLSEELTWNMYLGAVIILASVFAINQRPHSPTPTP